jgi:hypothetical protein
MFIFWGRKIVRRKIGHVADFCPICRGHTAFAVKSVGSAGHVYYISFGAGQLIGHERTCLSCDTSFEAVPSTYQTISKSLRPLPELIASTYPKLEEATRERLALEDRVKNDPAQLSPEERRSLIRSPLMLLSPKVEGRFASTHIDKEILLSMVGAVVLLIAGAKLVQAVAPNVLDIAAMALAGIGLVLIGMQFALSGKRYMNRQIVPVLVRTLAPLQPTEAELRSALDELRMARHKIGRKLRAGDVIDGIRTTTGKSVTQ